MVIPGRTRVPRPGVVQLPRGERSLFSDVVKGQTYRHLLRGKLVVQDRPEVLVSLRL